MEKSQTMKSLREMAKNNGFCCYWKSNKSALVEGLTVFEKTRKIPSEFKPKSRVSEPCEKDLDCRSKKCVDNLCKGTKKVSFSKRVKKYPSSDMKSKDVSKDVSKDATKVASNKSVRKNKKISNNTNEMIKESSRNRNNSTRSETTFTKDGKVCKSVCITRCK